MRSKKAILRIIRASQPSGPLDEQNLKQKTIPLLRSLLSDRVFEIEEVAKIDFPELWATSCPEQKPGETTKESNEASQASKKLDTAAPDIIIAATPRGMLLILKSATSFHVSHAQMRRMTRDVCRFNWTQNHSNSPTISNTGFWKRYNRFSKRHVMTLRARGSLMFLRTAPGAARLLWS